MKILVIGSGAREHAFVHAFSKDPGVTGIYAAPGNPGIAQLAQTFDIDPLNPTEVGELGKQLGVDLAVIGPEAPLVAGVADGLREVGIPTFGPSAQAAQLEGSKAFAKQVMEAGGVPTGRSRSCRTEQDLRAALDDFGAPHVVKDDGLAAGKGVVVTSDYEAALAHGLSCLEGGVVVEEFLDGPEVSLFCLSDGRRVIPLAPAQDFKRIGEGDTGPNTGGMGAYSPLPWAPEDLTEQVVTKVAQPTIDEMAQRGMPFVGLLYCGLALTADGVKVIEFNARFGDPETQSVLPRLKTPLAALLHAAALGELDQVGELQWHEEAAVTVVMASPGYPDTPRTGGVITGIAQAENIPGVHVLHAGTAAEGENLYTAGGRVLSVVGRGENVSAAREAAYEGLAAITFEGAQVRSDIAANV